MSVENKENPMNYTGSALVSDCAPTLVSSDTVGEFTIFVDGDQLYDDMLNAIRHARRSIWLESYIFAADEIGSRFITAMAEKATQGLDVKLHIDAAGSFLELNDLMKRYLVESGVKLKYFHRWHWRQPWRYNKRNHRKLLVIDNEVAFLGGFNIHRESTREFFGTRHWRDTHVRLKGKLPEDAAQLFDQCWRGRLHETYFHCRASSAVFTNSNKHCRQALHCLLKSLIADSKTTLYICTPYYVPDRKIQRNLVTIANRGVDVRLLVPAKGDVRLTRWAAQAAYASLLSAGVRVFEYQPRMLHAKTMVSDDDWSLVGTANMDYRSFFVNYEINLISRNRSLAVQLRQQFEQDLVESIEIHQVAWGNRRIYRYGLESVGWLMRRWL